jgi:hypothetical protein
MPKLVSTVSKPTDLVALLARGFRGVNAVVVGDVVLDRCVYTDRVAEPRHKQPLLNILKYERQDHQLAAGGAAMIARVAKAFGAKVGLCGVIGQDEEAGELHHLLAREGITFRSVQAKDRSTPEVARFFARIASDLHAEHVRIDREDRRNLPPRVLSEILNTTENLIRERRPRVVIVADFARGVVCREIVEELGHLLRQEEIPVVLDAKRCWDALHMPLALAVLGLNEAWDALRDEKREEWERLRRDDQLYLPEWCTPDDCRAFVVTLMDTFPNVRQFLVNDTFGGLLAITRDENLHGFYHYALVKPEQQHQVRSPVGSEAICAAIAGLCLARSRSGPVRWNDFFRIAYAAKCSSCVQMCTSAHDIAKPSLVAECAREWTWPAIPRGRSIHEAMSEREVRLQRAIDDLDRTLTLGKAVTCIPGIYTVHPGFRSSLSDAVSRLKDLLGQPLAKPARLWLQGPPGSGKDFLFQELIDKVLRRKRVVVQPDERAQAGFDLAQKFREAKGGAIVLNEMGEGLPPGMDVQLRTLLDDTRSQYGDLLVVGVTSRPEEQLPKAPSPDIRRRFARIRDDAAEIKIPAFEDRTEDLPYLLVSCLQYCARRANLPSTRLPSRFSKRALEVLVRSPDLLDCRPGTEHFTLTHLTAAADDLLRNRVDTVHWHAMARALKLAREERRTIFYADDNDTVCIDTWIHGDHVRAVLRSMAEQKAEQTDES